MIRKVKEEVKEQGTYYQVVVGTFTDKESAKKRVAELEAKGYQPRIDVKVI